MAWIQVHQQIKDHRKLLSAADELEIEPAHMLGLLVSFWLWALDNTPSGSLEGISSRMIARAAQWDGDPDEFVNAMENAGLLDEEKPGVLTIHDWYEYAGKLIDQREAEKIRSRRRRAASGTESAAKSKPTAGRPPDDRKKTGGIVDQTIVNQSKEDIGDIPHTPKTATDAKPDAQERRFDEFWQQYPKKVGKKAAQTAWKRLKPDADLHDRIMHAVALARTSEQWNREGGRFIPNPATWINQGRWDDEPAPVTAQPQQIENKKQASQNPFLAMLEGAGEL